MLDAFSHEELSGLLDALICALDAPACVVREQDGVIACVNDAFVAEACAEGGRVVGAHWRELVGGGLTILESRHESEQTTLVRAVYQTSEDEREARIRVRRVVVSSGVFLVCVVTEVTESLVVRERREMLEHTFEHIHDAVMICDLSSSGRSIGYVNAAFEKQTGWARGDVLGRSPDLLVGEGTDPEELARVERAIEQGEPVQSQLIFYDASGEPFWVELDVATFTGARSARVVHVLSDVTERRRILANVLQLDRVSAFGALSAGIVHELNNPLSFVLANIDFIEEVILGDDLEEERDDVMAALRETRSGVSRLRQLAQDIRVLTFEGDADVFEPTDVRDVINSALNIAGAKIRRRAELERDLDVYTPLVDANPNLLAQVFVNLLVNAAEALSEGPRGDDFVRVSIRTVAGHVLVTVEDSGHGIAPEHRPFVFEQFFTTKPRGVGVGLGLGLCRDIVRQHGGEITFATRPGLGTTFTVSLPAMGAEQLDAIESEAVELEWRPRVLVLDDEIGVARAVARLLEPAFDVRVCTDGLIALRDLANGERPDAIVCDVIMAPMMGTAFHQALIERDPELATRFVFMTGGALSAKSYGYVVSSGVEVIQKPLRREPLRERVFALVGEREDA